MTNARPRRWRRLIFFLVLSPILLLGGVAGFVWFKPESALQLLFENTRQRADLERKEVVLAGGVRLAYLDGGEGKPLVLLHGFGGNKDYFAPLARGLTPKYRVIIPDLAGFGESTKSADLDYSPTSQADRVHALLAGLDISSAHIAGTSMGGQIAATYAARYPQETASLLLINSAGIWSAKPSTIITNALQGNNAMLIGNVEDFLNLLDYITETPPKLPMPIARALADELIPLRPLHETISKQLLADSIEARIAGLKVPTQIVWGDRDRIIDVDAVRILRELIPGSKVEIMSGVGHNITYERPHELLRLYVGFLSAIE
jgi:pimeloyl-ACP methyl ester carboxylesterase